MEIIYLDWIKSGWITPVRNQQKCRNCYAFAATASIEASLWLKHKINVTLSPQQITDCSFNYKNLGCNGGLVAYSFGYTNDVGLIEDRYYSFSGKTNNCSANLVSESKFYKISKYLWLEKNNDTALMEALEKFGPIPVGINSSAPGFETYSSGIYAPSPGYCGTNIGLLKII